MEKSPQYVKEETLAYLEAEQPIWSDLKRRSERSRGLDAQLTSQYEDSYDRMNDLLDNLYMANLALQSEVLVGV